MSETLEKIEIREKNDNVLHAQQSFVTTEIEFISTPNHRILESENNTNNNLNVADLLDGTVKNVTKVDDIGCCIKNSSSLNSVMPGLMNLNTPPNQNPNSKISDATETIMMVDGNSKVLVTSTPSSAETTAEVLTKKKRKRRRGKKPKINSKPYKKSNWKFQMPARYRNHRGGNNNNATIAARDKFLRSNCIVPYNTNKFLMEEHMDEVPSELLTPSGRTRDSSFSVDSEDNYFYSLPEDEEEFLTKEFAHVYERARVERLESMTKQQLIEECLQLEDRYMQTSEHQHQSNNFDYINKIKYLEDRLRDLNAENLELRRRLDYAQSKLSQDERMCSDSEDSESDSSSSSSSSSNSCYSIPSYRNDYSPTMATNDSRMESDDITINQSGDRTNENEQGQAHRQELRGQQSQSQQVAAASNNGNNHEILCNGHLESSSPSSSESIQLLSPINPIIRRSPL